MTHTHTGGPVITALSTRNLYLLKKTDSTLYGAVVGLEEPVYQKGCLYHQRRKQSASKTHTVAMTTCTQRGSKHMIKAENVLINAQQQSKPHHYKTKMLLFLPVCTSGILVFGFPEGGAK